MASSHSSHRYTCVLVFVSIGSHVCMCVCVFLCVCGCVGFTGVIIHGHCSQVFIDFLQWAHDPNLTTNILVKVIYEHFKHLKETYSIFPSKLYLQLDNTARENKNKAVLEFLALLIQQGVFAEVIQTFDIVVIFIRNYFSI